MLLALKFIKNLVIFYAKLHINVVENRKCGVNLII